MTERRFSERLGYVSVPTQLDSMNDSLRNSIWNVIRRTIPEWGHLGAKEAAEAITEDVLRLPIEAIDRTSHAWVLKNVQQMEWYRVYDLLEYAVGGAELLSRGAITTRQMIETANFVLEQENSAFRFVGGKLTRIIEPVEVKEVERALAQAAAVGLDGARAHIEQAVVLFGKRPDPDYRNAIKEAISALESAVKQIEGVRGGGLQGPLDALAGRVSIHKAFREGFVKLFGFASDGDGIRHAMMEEANVGEEDARFMVVTCSAAVNWIISKAQKAGLLKRT